jgi:hypothetical protein
MKLRYYKGLLAGFVLLLLVSFSNAQNLELGLFGGGSYYVGEMNSWFHFNKTQLAYGAIARLNINPRWAVRLSYYRGGIKGTDTLVTRAVPNNYSFNSTVNDITAIAEFNFWEYFTGSKKNYFTPYVFAGLTYYLSDYSSGIAIPFGAGCKVSLSKRFSLGAEWGLRKTFSDEIDGVNATEYQSGIDLGVDKTSTWDWYGFAGVTVTYKINLRSKTKCNMEGW